MAALEAKAFGDISTHTAAASSSGSSSGDSASMAAALAASADAQHAAATQRAREKDMLDALRSALKEQIAAHATVKKYTAYFPLDAKLDVVHAAYVGVFTSVAGVQPKGLHFADIMSRGVPIRLPVLLATSATKVSEVAIEVERSLELVTPAMDSSDAVPMNPYMRYLQMIRRQAALVIKECPYLVLIDSFVRQIILSMLHPMWQASTSVHLSESTLDAVTLVYAALGRNDVQLYNDEIRWLMSSPGYLPPVGGFLLHKLLSQVKELYQSRMEKLANLQVTPALYQLALLSASLPGGADNTALKNEMDTIVAEFSAFIHAPPGTSEEHVLAFLDTMLEKYAHRTYSGTFVFPTSSTDKQSVFLGAEESTPWGSSKRQQLLAPSRVARFLGSSSVRARRRVIS
jgi:hypothetical protein